jgi:2-polyprenyl-3-methyl-5-hydroxy-6-metoxy-1,4-benzoquinol methylase
MAQKNPPSRTTVPTKNGWASIIEAAASNTLALFALVVLTVEAILGIVLVPTPARDRFWIVVAMVTLLGIVIICATVVAALHPDTVRRITTNVQAQEAALPETEKQRLIRANEEFVIDAEKPPLTHDDLTRQLQQLRLVLYQAPRYSTPTYYLDTHLSVIDWNVAFGLIFKPILGKIRRRHVNYLIAELANHDEVFDHAREFTEKVKNGQLPLADIEPLVYGSDNYGMVEFEKVATQLTDVDANIKAWAVALFIRRIDWNMYGPDLLKRLRDEKLWGIYAVSYDKVLSDFSLYRQLIDEVIHGVPTDANSVLEIGAGTGNVTQALLQRGYRVTAVENNPLMLEKMSAKRLVQTGRLNINMDSVEDFDFVGDGHFDAAVAVNVVYALDDPFACFRKVAQALKPGGLFALSTTHSETNVDPLLAVLEAELKTKGTFRSKEEHYRRVVAINKDLEYGLARRYSRAQYETWLEQAGFEITYNQLSYKDAVVVIHARKI